MMKNNFKNNNISISRLVIDNKFDFDDIVKEFDEIDNLRSIPQNPRFHNEGSVYIHTRNVCRELVKLAEWKALDINEKVIVYLSAMFHDIGKGVCTKLEDNEIISPKHAVKGEKIFRRLAYTKYDRKFDISFNMRESICSLIRYHGLPLVFMDKENMDYELIKTAECIDIKLLYILAKSDLLGRDCSDKNELLNIIEWFKDYAEEIGCFYNKKRFTNDYTRFKYLNDKNIWHGDEVFDSSKFDVFIMCGLPLAGKDTYIEENFKGMPVIALDDIREELKISPRDYSGKIANVAKERAKVLLREQKSFVWNATNIMSETRMKLCRLFSNYGARVNFIYIEASYRELFIRNNKRKRTVDKKVIDKMITRFDMLEPWEGFKQKIILND